MIFPIRRGNSNNVTNAALNRLIRTLPTCLNKPEIASIIKSTSPVNNPLIISIGVVKSIFRKVSMFSIPSLSVIAIPSKPINLSNPPVILPSNLAILPTRTSNATVNAPLIAPANPSSLNPLIAPKIAETAPIAIVNGRASLDNPAKATFITPINLEKAAKIGATKAPNAETPLATAAIPVLRNSIIPPRIPPFFLGSGNPPPGSSSLSAILFKASLNSFCSSAFFKSFPSIS